MGTLKKMTNDEIFVVIKQFFLEIAGDEPELVQHISRETIVSKEIPLDSIRLDAFIEKIKQHYGEHIDLMTWFYNLNIEQVMQLKIDDVIEYIKENTSTQY